MSAPRPGLRTVLLLVGTWLAGAAIAVTVGFFAVGRVGEDLNNGNSVPTPDSELRQAAERASSPAETTTSVPPTTDTSSTSSSKSVPPPEDEVDTPSPTTGEPEPGLSAQTRRFTTEGGAVAASCTGATIKLLYAYPNDGYTSEVGTSAQTIEVEFHSPGEEVHVKIGCAGGVPTRIEQEGEETEDH